MSALGRLSLSRRRLLRLCGLGLASTSLLACAPTTAPRPSTSELRSRVAPARGAARDPLSLLLWGHFVPAYDEWFDTFAQRWGAQNNLQVRVDHVPNLELPARYAAEVASQAGHDIVQFAATGGPNLFARHLEDQDELMNRLDREHGGWEASARNLAFVDGHWKAFPDFFLCPTICYRIDMFQQEGLEPPRTWNDLLVSGARLKAKGYPGGIGYVAGHPDANVASRAILWSFGGSYVAQDGRSVTLNSKETREALRFGKALLDEAMTDEVFSWDDTSNNKMLAAGRAAWIHNPISAYLTIKKENPELAEKIGIAPTPMGPVDRRTAASPNTFGIWRFAQNKPAAHRFLADYAANWIEGLKASSGYNFPMLKGWAKQPMPVLGDGPDPKLRIVQDLAPDVSFMGYPGPVTPPADEVWQLFLIPQMFAKYAKGGDLDGSIASTEEAIRKIYAKWQK